MAPPGTDTGGRSWVDACILAALACTHNLTGQYARFPGLPELPSCRWEGLSLAYTEAQGLPALREALAASPAHYTTIAPEARQPLVLPALWLRGS